MSPFLSGSRPATWNYRGETAERIPPFQRGHLSQEDRVAQFLGLPKIPAKLTLAFLPKPRPAIHRRAFSLARLQRDGSRQAVHISHSLDAPAIVSRRLSFDLGVVQFRWVT
jgi:hypothetical protein